MENNLNFRIKYPQLFIEIGLQWIESFSYSDPQKIVDYYFPPRDSIMKILKEEQKKTEKSIGYDS